MKFTTITNGNIHLIKHRMEQFVNRHDVIEDTWHYPTTQKRNKTLPADERKTEKSYTSTGYKNQIVIALRDSIVKEGDRLISIRYSDDTAFSMRVGDKVKIASSRVVLMHDHPTQHNEKAKIILIGKRT